MAEKGLWPECFSSAGLPLAPVNVNYEDVDSQSVLLKWLQPASVMATNSPTADASTEVSTSRQEAVIRSFIIELRVSGSRTVRRPVFASNTAIGLPVKSDSPVPEGVGFENEYPLLFMKPGVKYTIRIAATNRHGIGPYSDAITVKARGTGRQDTSTHHDSGAVCMPCLHGVRVLQLYVWQLEVLELCSLKQCAPLDLVLCVLCCLVPLQIMNCKLFCIFSWL